MREAEDLSKTNTTEDEGREGSYSTRVPNRYFILKSLTVEDLGISRQSGIWATQTHNEENLNRAFEVSGPERYQQSWKSSREANSIVDNYRTQTTST
jgi:hypothetical protein